MSVRVPDERLAEVTERISNALSHAPHRASKEPRDALAALVADLRAERADNQRLRKSLGRAAYVAEHLFGMVDRETWRATGGDDGQGHYEGDYRAEQTQAEIITWKALAEEPRA